MAIRSRRRRRQPIWLLVLLVLLSGSSLYVWQFQKSVAKKNPVELVAPVAALTSKAQKPAASPLEELSQIDGENLQKIVSAALSGTTGTYAVTFKNLKTGEHFELNPDHVFESASLYKLWVMASVYQAEKDGSLEDDQVLSEDIPTLNQKFQIDPDLAEQTEGTITYSVHDALYQMITISDNYSALLLTEKIGLSYVANFLDQNGFSQSNVATNGGDPTTTAYDIEVFLEKLYQGKLVDQSYSQKMIDLLKQQKLNSKIPQGLPSNITVAHKTGEIDTFTHDVGIIFTPNGNYILVVLSDSDNPSAAEGRISDISQAIYAYFNNGG